MTTHIIEAVVHLRFAVSNEADVERARTAAIGRIAMAAEEGSMQAEIDELVVRDEAGWAL